MILKIQVNRVISVLFIFFNVIIIIQSRGGNTSRNTFPTLLIPQRVCCFSSNPSRGTNYSAQTCSTTFKDSLTGDQARKFAVFEQKIQTDPVLSERMKYQDSNFKVDSSCLFRYLTANRWDFTAAITGILNTIEWRKETGIGNMGLTEEIKAQGVTPKIINHGFSKFGHPVIYLVPRYENSGDEEKQFKYVIFNMELAIKRMPEGIHQVLLIIDLSGLSESGGMSIAQTKRVINMVSNHYPERLFRTYMLNAPWYYKPIWKLVSVFIDPVTKSKMLFVKGGRTSVDSGLDLGSQAGSPWQRMLHELDEVDFLHDLMNGKPDTSPFKSEAYFQAIQEFLTNKEAKSVIVRQQPICSKVIPIALAYVAFE